MKIAFLLLLMTATVFALWDDKNKSKEKHAHKPVLGPGPDCVIRADCRDFCKWDCNNVVFEALCIDGTCFCLLKEAGKKKKHKKSHTDTVEKTMCF